MYSLAAGTSHASTRLTPRCRVPSRSLYVESRARAFKLTFSLQVPQLDPVSSKGSSRERWEPEA